MITYEWLYAMEAYLNNLLMFKIVHDEGIDLSDVGEFELSSFSYYSLPDEGYSDNFTKISEYLFEIFEVFPCDYEGGTKEDKEYWIKLCESNHKISASTEVIVIMDDSLQNPITGIVGVSDFTDAFAEMFKIEEGIVLIYDTDYGPIDYADTMAALLESRK